MKMLHVMQKQIIHKHDDVAVPWAVGVDVVNRDQLDSHTNKTTYKIVDRLAACPPPSAANELETVTGVNRAPPGMLSCPELRAIVQPIHHYIRDWQHTTLASHGVISSQIAGVMRELKRRRIPWADAEQFSLACHESVDRRSKFNASLFSSKHVEDEYVKAFAGEILPMVLRLFLFLWMHPDAAQFSGMFQHTRCIGLLLAFQLILQHVKEFTAAVVAKFKSLADEWGKLFVR